MNGLDLKILGDEIIKVFVEQDKYQLTKHLQEFMKEGKYVGDFLTYIIYEDLGTEAPLFYSIVSSYDNISHKAPQQAFVFQDGNLLLNIDYTHYADVRTGLMDALVVSSLGHSSMEGKKILYLGTGKVARESLKGINAFFPEVTDVDFINKSGEPKEFGELARQLKISIKNGSLDHLEEYDYIFAHTASSEPVITADYLEKIKKGAVITTFVGPGTEIADEFFNSEKANILVDWEGSFTIGKDLERAIATNILDKQKATMLKDLFSNNMQTNPHAHYTLYRSTGTPMQNLAVLKLLLEK